jgi:hypothetical protein
LFVQLGLLPSEGRVAFTKAPDSLFSAIDLDKAKNQIPLIDLDTRNVYYGIDAVVEVLARRFSFIRTICKWKYVNYFLKKLYNLISYNRKVIVAKKCGNGQFDCSPAFNKSYRVFFMVIFLLFNSVMLWPLHHCILSTLSFYHLSVFQLETAHFLFVAANCLLACILPFDLAMEYLGQVNMLALCTVLLVIPLIAFVKLFGVNDLVVSVYLIALTAFIVTEYFRRMKYAGIFSGYRFVVGINLLCLAIFLGYLFI